MLRLRSYERLLVENRRFRSNWGRLTQNFTYKGSPPTNHSSSRKTRINVLSYGIKIWTDLSSILSGITCVIDRQTEFSSLDRVCISCSAVKRSQKISDGQQNVDFSFIIPWWKDTFCCHCGSCINQAPAGDVGGLLPLSLSLCLSVCVCACSGSTSMTAHCAVFLTLNSVCTCRVQRFR